MKEPFLFRKKVNNLKNTCILFLCIVLIFSVTIPASALEAENSVVVYQSTSIENGITIIDEILDQTQARSVVRTYTRRKSYYNGETLIAVIAITGNFSYNGTTVSVTSKTVSQTDTYDGWSYKQTSFTSSGGTITLDAKLTKLLVLSIPVNMTLSCDKNGNISYT